MATTTTSDTDATDAGHVDGETDDVGTPKRRPSSTRSALEWAGVIFGAVVVALLIKTFVMQAFYIPSESMLPVLEKNDRVLVNKLSYRLHDVNRGDVVVFELAPEQQADPTKDLIKRVIGLPGDSLVFKDGNVYVNGRQLDEQAYLPAGTLTGQGSVLRCEEQSPCKVPDDSVFVMGDNRTNSKDSRYIGYIKEDTIVGRAFVRVWPFNRVSGL
jgi:signal peptidase I